MEMKSPVEQEQEHFHVLAVDDSILDRKLLERLLKFSSYEVTCVDSGDKALEYLGLMDKTDNSSSVSPPTSSSQQGVKVNMIMTDYCMPGMTGYDLLKKVKDSSWKDVPVVVMSSENIPSRITKCLEEGAEQFILKPVQLSDVEKLQSRLRKTLRTNDSPFCSNKPEINASKRKAMSPQPPERTKIQRLAVL